MYVDGLHIVGSGIKIGVVEANNKGPALPATGTEGQTFELTETYMGKTPNVYWWFNGEWVLKSPDQSATPYDISGGSIGLLGISAIVSRMVIPRAFAISGGFLGSLAIASQGAAANTVLEIRRINRQGVDGKIGEIQFAAGNNVGVFVQNGSGDIQFAVGEIIYTIAPETPDSTLADIAFTIAGRLI